MEDIEREKETRYGGHREKNRDKQQENQMSASFQLNMHNKINTT